MLGPRDTACVQLPGGEVLPGIDLDELARYIEITPTTRAVNEYGAVIRARG